MSNIIVACSSNAPYLPRIKPYLETLSEHSPFDNVLVCVGCDVPELPAHVRGVSLSRELLATPVPLDHVQSGDFLQVLDGPEDDVIIFTDGDVCFQRPPTVKELRGLQNWPHDVVGLGWNDGPNNTLLTEAIRLGLKVPLDTIAAYLDGAAPPCYNTGVIVARRSTWWRWYHAFVSRFEEVESFFTHYAKQQWLMCATLYFEGIPVHLLPYTFHTHGCFGVPEGVTEGNDASLWVGDTPVLFRHHWMC